MLTSRRGVGGLPGTLTWLSRVEGVLGASAFRLWLEAVQAYGAEVLLQMVDERPDAESVAAAVELLLGGDEGQGESLPW